MAKAAAVEREQEERERAARLERLAALVAPQVVADPQRVLQPTAAFAAHTEEDEDEYDETRGEGPAFKPVNGYTNKAVMRDGRFRLMEALTRAGLANTEAGRIAIASATPATAPRRDNLTAQQRGVLQ